MPLIRSAVESASAFGTSGNSDFLARNMITTMPRIVAPRAVWMTLVGSARPIIAPKIELVEAISAIGIARRRSAIPLRSRPGPAASAPASATSRPAPRTKSRLNGKKPLTIGTKSTPPPTPPRTATMPITKQTTNSASGQTCQGTLDGAAAAAAAVSPPEAIRRPAQTDATARRTQTRITVFNRVPFTSAASLLFLLHDLLRVLEVAALGEGDRGHHPLDLLVEGLLDLAHQQVDLRRLAQEVE